jgi:hypothetical protein
MKTQGHVGDMGMNERIILKWVLKGAGVGM